jgi:hypothetical protein
MLAMGARFIVFPPQEYDDAKWTAIAQAFLNVASNLLCVMGNRQLNHLSPLS